MVSLVDEILNGRTEQFRVLIREYNDDLLRISYQFFHDWDEAQETCQKTWIKVYKSLNSYNRDKPFKQWLLKIHTNGCKTHYRQSLWRRFTRISDEQSLSEISVHEENKGNSEVGRILEILKTFTWRQRSIFILCELHEISSIDVGKIIGISDSTVRVQLARVRKKLELELTK